MAALMIASTARPIARTTASKSFNCSSSRLPFVALSPAVVRRTVIARAEPGEKKQQTDSRDSYQKIEEPVRSVFPEGSDSGAQNFGASQGEADDFLKSKEANRDTEIFGTEVGVADAMRFKGAAPEVINCRLAMLGFVAAVLVENATGKNVIQQTQTEQFPIAVIVITFIIASLVPIVRGVPRKGNSIFTADAELWNGRLAMLGIAALYWNAYISPSSLTPLK
ncbi:hypothetical protein ABBQ32_004917 [Trebouxia sp. C0010 RCD-2024]